MTREERTYRRRDEREHRRGYLLLVGMVRGRGGEFFGDLMPESSVMSEKCSLEKLGEYRRFKWLGANDSLDVILQKKSVLSVDNHGREAHNSTLPRGHMYMGK